MRPFSPDFPINLTPVPPAYRFAIGVCTNVAQRDFRQCNPKDGQAVYQGVQDYIQAEHALGRHQDIYIHATGCILGCQPEGTTVVIAEKKPPPQPDKHWIFTHVTPQHIQAVFDLLTQLAHGKP